MKVLKIHEEDPTTGEVVIDFEMSDEENNFFIQYAINDILKKQIADRQEEVIEDEEKLCFDCGEVIDPDTLDQFPDTEICSECINDRG